MRFWSKAGTLEGTISGIQKTLGPDTYEAVLNGRFFDPKYGYWGCPSQKVPKGWSTQPDGSDKWNSIKFVRSNSADKIDKRGLSDAYNDSMVQLYYLNPVTWMKSLVNGEGFAWVSDNLVNKSNALLLKTFKEESLGVGVLSALKDRGFWEFYNKFRNADEKTKFKLSQSKEYEKYGGMMSRVTTWLGDQEKYTKYAEFTKLASK